MAMFEDDERYKAVDRPSDREDLFQNYLVDLQKKVSCAYDLSDNEHTLYPYSCV